MPTKLNSAGEQQPYDAETGRFAETQNALSMGYTRNEVASMSDKDRKVASLQAQLKEAKGIFAKARIKEQIEMLEGGFNSIEELRKHKQAERDKLIEESDKKKQAKVDTKQTVKDQNIVDKERKQKQLEIILKENPAFTDNAVWIRELGDIKTFAETFNDEESFVYPDYTREDAEKDLKRGKVRVYSSKDLKNGNFVSPSKMQASEYAGGGEIHSALMDINDIAWINGDEGQIAKI